MYTLAIEASNRTLSVALLKDDTCLVEETTYDKLEHSVYLVPMVERVFQAVKVSPSQLEKIILSNGPGSYTGLRIGVTFAKTLAYTLKIPLIAVSSLKTLAHGANSLSDSVVISFFDARRENVYVGVYQRDLTCVFEKHCAFSDVLTYCQTVDKPIVFVSPDIEMYQEMIANANLKTSVSCQKVYPTAQNVYRIGRDVKKAVDSHVHTPTYLKLAEAEENWLKNHQVNGESLVERNHVK